MQALAAAVGPPQPAFSQCASSNRFDAAIAADVATAERVGFTGTPSFVIGRTTGGDSLTGMTMTGAYALGSFETEIAAAAGTKSNRTH